MYDAYNNGKDLYAIIAQSAFHNNYEDNLEFHPEARELTVDGKKVYAGSGKEKTATLIDNSITVPCFYLLPTETGDIAASELKPGDQIISDIGNLTIKSIIDAEEIQLLGGKVPQLCIVFEEK